jgi:hypothetical protein
MKLKDESFRRLGLKCTCGVYLTDRGNMRVVGN